MYGLLRSGISATTRREAVRSFQSACALRSVQPSGEDILKYKFNPNETTNIKKASSRRATLLGSVIVAGLWTSVKSSEGSERTMTDANANWKEASSVYDFTVKDIRGNDVPLKNYEGHVLLIVNVASQCGLTSSNYKELTALDDKYRESHGLRILAFPCNQFGGQEPGGAEEICSFRDKQNAKFDFFEKIHVNGDDAHPLWKYLKSKQGGLLASAVKWNFTKFLVDKNGQVVERFGPMDSFSKIDEKLQKYF